MSGVQRVKAVAPAAPGLISIPAQPSRRLVLGASLVAGCAFVGVLTVLFGDSMVGVVLLDSQSRLFPYPFTIQNLMHLTFFVGNPRVQGRLNFREGTREFPPVTLSREQQKVLVATATVGPDGNVVIRTP